MRLNCTYIILLVVIILMAGCREKNNDLPFYNTPDFTPVWLKPGDEGYTAIHTIPAFRFTNQLGNSISNKNTQGKIYVANFFFTACQNICPAMMENLQRVQREFAKDQQVLILSHTVTPLRDSVPVLHKYAQRKHIDGKKWWLLTGERDLTYKLARQAYFADNETGYSKTNDEFLHTENLVLIDTKGRLRGVYNSSLTTEINTLISDIKQLETEEN